MRWRGLTETAAPSLLQPGRTWVSWLRIHDKNCITHDKASRIVERSWSTITEAGRGSSELLISLSLKFSSHVIARLHFTNVKKKTRSKRAIVLSWLNKKKTDSIIWLDVFALHQFREPGWLMVIPVSTGSWNLFYEWNASQNGEACLFVFSKKKKGRVGRNHSRANKRKTGIAFFSLMIG